MSDLVVSDELFFHYPSKWAMLKDDVSSTWKREHDRLATALHESPCNKVIKTIARIAGTALLLIAVVPLAVFDRITYERFKHLSLIENEFDDLFDESDDIFIDNQPDPGLIKKQELEIQAQKEEIEKLKHKVETLQEAKILEKQARDEQWEELAMQYDELEQKRLEIEKRNAELQRHINDLEPHEEKVAQHRKFTRQMAKFTVDLLKKQKELIERSPKDQVDQLKDDLNSIESTLNSITEALQRDKEEHRSSPRMPGSPKLSSESSIIINEIPSISPPPAPLPPPLPPTLPPPQPILVPSIINPSSSPSVNVNNNNQKQTNDSNSVLNSIKKGVQLKKVLPATEPKKPSWMEDEDNLFSALARAMTIHRNNLNEDGDDEDKNNSDFDE